MKKFIAWVLCASMLLSGCTLFDKRESVENTSGKNYEKGGKTHSIDEQILLKLPKPIESTHSLYIAKRMNTELDRSEIPELEFTPRLKDYKVNSDLSNVYNLDRINGLTDTHKKVLAENCFIVTNQHVGSEGWLFNRMFNVYERNEYDRFPNFISVDSALHIYGVLYDNVLKNVERDSLISDLRVMTEHMLKGAFKLYNETNDEKTKEMLSDVICYYAVPAITLGLNIDELTPQQHDIVDEELARINAHEGYYDCPLTSSIINYMQFKPRGHYDGDFELEVYFKAMMWYGLVGFEFRDDAGELKYDNISKAMLITYISFMDETGKAAAMWDKIYSITDMFVGGSDDLGIYDVYELIVAVYGENADYTNFTDERFKEVVEVKLKDLRNPQIVADVESQNIATGLQFRLMGQRYSIDADLMQNLIEANTRPVPTVLDVASVLGSDTAVKVAQRGALMNWTPERYEEIVLKLREKFDKLKDTDWDSNISTAWLGLLKIVFNYTDKNLDGYPQFMKTDAYKLKTLNTGAGSYAELKHANLLYAKQPMAEKGDGYMEQEFPPYVEPMPEVYYKLFLLAKKTDALLTGFCSLTEEQKYDYRMGYWQSLNELASIYELFCTVSVKELQGEELSEEEKINLTSIGGYFEFIEREIRGDEMDYSRSNSVVADISQIADTQETVEIATGLPDEIFVLVPYNDGFYIAHGPVYSYYEFITEQPLTDSEWESMLGRKTDDYGYDIQKYLYSLPERPYWVNEYKFNGENPVNIIPLPWEPSY